MVAGEGAETPTLHTIDACEGISSLKRAFGQPSSGDILRISHGPPPRPPELRRIRGAGEERCSVLGAPYAPAWMRSGAGWAGRPAASIRPRPGPSWPLSVLLQPEPPHSVLSDAPGIRRPLPVAHLVNRCSAACSSVSPCLCGGAKQLSFSGRIHH